MAHQSACHLGQRAARRRRPVVNLLRAVPGLVAHDDRGGMCCGAGCAYSALQLSFAQQMGQRKTGRIAALDADVVATGNAGLHHAHGHQGLRVVHPSSWWSPLQTTTSVRTCSVGSARDAELLAARLLIPVLDRR